MWWVCGSWRLMVTSRSGSKITMSASEPTAIVPLRGNMPKIRAGPVEVTSTKRLTSNRPALTPWWKMRLIRFSTPGPPFGMRLKSPRPSSFCSRRQNGQWSVEMTSRSRVRSPRHSSSWFHFSRSGGVSTYFAPSKPGSS